MTQSRGVVLTLMYGEYPQMHARFLQRLVASLPPDVEIRIGLNAVGEKSLDLLSQHTGVAPAELSGGVAGQPTIAGRWQVYTDKNTNRLKYPVMREMLRDLSADYFVWLDDDTMLPGNTQWWDFGAERMSEGAQYMGKEFVCKYAGRQLETVKQRPWYRGKAPEMTHGAYPTFRFYVGGFWLLAVPLANELDWPDPIIRHNGGDTLLGEAVRQVGGKKVHFPVETYGIAIDSEKRRGHRELPAGFA